MPGRSRLEKAWRGLLLCVLVQTLGCASHPAPRGWLPRAAQVPKETRGGWVVIKLGGQKEELAGELIAAGGDGIHVLTGSGLQNVPAARIERARVAGFQSDVGPLWVWTTAGMLSTLSHGGYLILTAPLWLLGGAGASAVESHSPILEFPDKPLAELRKYARFPQGLPAGVDPASLGGLEAPPVTPPIGKEP